MSIKVIIFAIGIVLIFLRIKMIVIFNGWWIFLCFFIWFILLYISIHKKNKELNTPRPVYLTNY